MTPAEIEEMLKETGITFRYHHFTQKEMKDIPLPIIVWNIPGTDNFFADGQVYSKIKNLDIELYTDEKDWAWEEKLEDILDSLIIKEQLHQLAEEVHKLDDVYKSVLELKYIAGFSNDEIASVLKIKKKTVEMRLYRANLLLRKNLKGQGDV